MFARLSIFNIIYLNNKHLINLFYFNLKIFFSDEQTFLYVSMRERENVASQNIKDKIRENKKKLINLKEILKFNRIKTVTKL